MRTNEKKRRYAVVAGVTAAALIGGGVAIAYWTTTGSGSGAAATGTSTLVTVAQDNAVSGLYPGGPDQELDFTVTNPGPAEQYVTDVAISVSGTSNPGCTAADFDVTQPTVADGDLVVGDTAFEGASTGAAIRMINSASNQDACKGVTVSLAYAVS
jgi:hypothetical protein